MGRSGTSSCQGRSRLGQLMQGTNRQGIVFPGLPRVPQLTSSCFLKVWVPGGNCFFCVKILKGSRDAWSISAGREVRLCSELPSARGHGHTQEAPAEHQENLFHWEGDEWNFPSRTLHLFRGIQFM